MEALCSSETLATTYKFKRHYNRENLKSHTDKECLKTGMLRIFGLKRNGVTGGWRKLHEELHNLYSSPNIIRKINQGGFDGWSMGREDEKCVQKFWLGRLNGRDHSEDPGVDGRLILKWMLGRRVEGVDWIHLAQDRGR
jgi:hypothetical protein